uniref:Uncharacterized protein n=1 Tax=Rhizophora mucronata TaxID=61149 RepID=A0A2P2II73_RHIMU
MDDKLTIEECLGSSPGDDLRCLGGSTKLYRCAYPYQNQIQCAHMGGIASFI